jgi:hypothetical protein
MECFVIAGLDPAIHDVLRCSKDVDARDKRGHDGWPYSRFRRRSIRVTLAQQGDFRGKSADISCSA